MENNPHTHKEEPRSWEERFDAEFVCVGGIDECKLPHPPYLKDNTNVANLKSFIATREKEVREEFLKKLPDEFIIHGYMEEQGDGLSKDYCEGWNDYRGEIIRRLRQR